MRITLSITRSNKKPSAAVVDMQEYRAVVDDCFGNPAAWLVVSAPDRDTARRGVAHQSAAIKAKLQLVGPVQVSVHTGPFAADWGKQYRLGEIGRISVTLGKPRSARQARKARKAAEAAKVTKVKVAA